MEQYKIFQTGDWELTKERLKIVEPVVESMLEFFLDPANDFDLFAYVGDLFAEGGFCPETVRFVNKWIPKFASRKASKISGPGTFIVHPMALLGNHDWLIGEDKISALFSESGLVNVITSPKVLRMARPWSEDPWTPTIGILPAPDRAGLGAYTGPQGPRERDAEISKVLEAALIDLEVEAGEEQSKALLLFHGTVNSTYFNGSKLSSGLTWTVDAERLQGWGAAVGGHIHGPAAISTDTGTHIVYVGTIVPDRHGMKAQSFRAISTTMYKTEPPALASIPLPRTVIPIELTITPEGILVQSGLSRDPDARAYILTEGETPAFYVLDYLERDAGILLSTDLVDLKIRLQLPRFQLNEWPTDQDLLKEIHKLAGRELIYKLQVKREETNTDKIRLDHLDENNALDLGELICEWAKASGLEDHKRLADALGLLKGAEFSEWRSEGHKGIRMIRTVVKNFRQWADVTIDWTDLRGAVAVIGDNATGKTNLAEAPLFAWYKRTPSTSGGLAYELRLGQKDGFVEHTWEVDGKIYLARRALERAANGTVSCKSELFEIRESIPTATERLEMDAGEAVDLGPDRLVPVCEKAVDIDKKIVEINGATYDFMVSTIYGTQGQVDNLVDATPTTWHKLTIESLGLDRFELFRAACTKSKSEIEKDLSKHTAKIEELDEQIATKQEELSDIDTEALTLSIDRTKSLVQKVESDVKELEDERAKVTEEKAEIRAKISELVKVADRLEAVDKKIATAEKDRDDAADIGDRPEIPVDTEAKIATGEALLADHRALTKEMDEEIEKEQRKVAAMQADKNKTTIELEVLEADFKNRETRIADLTAQASAVKGPPCEALILEDDGATDALMGRCQAWLQFSGSGALDAAKAANGQLGTRVSELKSALAVTVKTEAYAAGILKAQEDNRTGAANEARRVEEKTGELKNLLKAAELWDAKSESKVILRAAHVELLLEQSNLNTELKGQDDLTEKESQLFDRGIDLRERILTLKQNKLTLREDLRVAEKALALHAMICSLIEDNAKKITAYKAEIGGWGDTAEAWGLLERAFHHTGLPFLLLERMVPVFEATANDLLSGTDLAIHFHTQREVGEGKERHLKDEIHVDYTDPRGTFPLKSSSGAQARKLGLTARFTMAKVGAEFWGRTPMIFIQDEGWGAFHSSRLNEAMELIRKVADVYETFLFITHVDQLAEGADLVLETRLLPDGSSSLVY